MPGHGQLCKFGCAWATAGSVLNRTDPEPPAVASLDQRSMCVFASLRAPRPAAPPGRSSTRKRRRRRQAGALIFSVCVLLAASASALAADVQRLSVKADGARAEGNSRDPFISADGQLVVFASSSDLTQSGATTQGVYVRHPGDPASIRRLSDGYPVGMSAAGDRLMVMTETSGLRVVDPADGTILWSTPVPGNNLEYGGAISTNGRFVTWAHVGSDGHLHIRIHDMDEGTTEELPDPGVNWEHPTISDDGRYVAFQPALAFETLWIYDREADHANSVGIGQMSYYQSPRISPDGSKVLFNAQAGDLHATHSFVADVVPGAGGVVTLAGITDLTPEETVASAVDSWDPTGRFVSFSASDSLDPADVNGGMDVYVYDTATGQTRLASRNASGAVGDRQSGFLPPYTESALSANAGMVVFMSMASNLVADDGSGVAEELGSYHGNPIYRTDVYSSDLAPPTGDTTAPTISAAELAPNPIWVGDTSQLNVSAADTGSGVVRVEYFIGADPGEGNGTALTAQAGTFTGTVGPVAQGGDLQVYVRARDAVGNWSQIADRVLVVYDPDTTPPEVTGAPAREPNAFGWYREPVQISWTAIDPLPSSGAASIPSVTLADTEGEAVPYTSAPSCDAAGNCASGTFAISLDATAPDLVLNSPADGAVVPEGTYQAPTCEATDALSGLDGVCSVEVSDPTVVGNGLRYTATARAFDRAGNQATISRTYTVSSDLDGPQITATPDQDPNAAGWYREPIRFTFACIDPSGVASCPDPFTFGEGTNQAQEFSASDQAGNSSQLTVSGVNVDLHDPEIAFTGAQATYTPDQAISITCEATDALSGIATANCPGLQAGADTLAIGTTTLSASATDRAGNQTTQTIQFTLVVTPGSLANVVDQYLDAGQPGNGGVASALKAKLAAGSYAAFINQVQAQTGKRLTEEEAANLIRLVNELL